MKEVHARARALHQEMAKPSREQLQSGLRGLGLSGYAADAFAALADVAEATAADLVRRTGIPDSKIYYALDELRDEGLIEVQAGKPKTYRAVPPREAEARLLRRVEASHERERAAVTRVVALLEPLRAAAASPATDIAYVVKGLANVAARAEALVASARRDVVLLTSDEEFLRKLESALAKAARHAKVRLAIPDVTLDKELARAAEVRSIVCNCMILVVDGQQMLTVNRAPDGTAYGITSTDETLVRLGLDWWESPRCCVG